MTAQFQVTERLQQILKDGTVLYDNTLSLDTVIPFGDVAKQSVDTGRFIPNEFRINPYYVSRSGFIPEQLTLSVTTDVEGIFDRIFTVQGPSHLLSTTINDVSAVPLPNLSQDSDICLQKAYAKVGEAQLQLGVEFGEFRETLATLRHPFGSLRKLLTQDGGRLLKALWGLKGMTRRQILITVKRTNPKFQAKDLSRKTAQSAVDTWMELRYGLRPICASILQILEYCQAAEKKIPLGAIRSRKSQKLRETSAYVVSGDKLYMSSVRTRSQVSDSGLAVGRVYYRLLAERTRAEKLGYDATYLPETIWALTRLSFVVDWLFSVQTWLASWRVMPNIEILGDSVSEKITRTVMTTVELSADGNKSPTQDVELYNLERFTRRINVGRPGTPQFLGVDKLDLPKLVDSLSLILQPLLRRK